MEHFVLGTPSIPLDRPSSSHRTGRVPFFSLIAGAAIGLLVRWAATLCERCPWCEAWGEDVEPLVLSDPWAGGLSYQCLACGHLWDASGFGERCC